ncbi:ScbR family autoregulator-binding transcription factor [Streptomyces scabiei]|uniref:ScbR family autoregulator-binding transcription factor n=1 Tax=Streptomyces scabiei TaxID=1930 RepID=UPI003696AA3B
MPRQERAERTREQIVRAAAVCFDTKGFGATSLSDIVEAARVSKGALYFHFTSKEKLAQAVAAQASADWRIILRAARAPGGPVLQVLIDTTHGLAYRIRHDVVFRAGLRLSDERRPGGSGHPGAYPSWRRAVALMLARAGRRGELLPGLEPGHAARLLTAATAGVEMLSRQDRSWLATTTVTHVWESLLPALVPPDRIGHLRPAGRATLPASRGASPRGAGTRERGRPGERAGWQGRAGVG